MEAMKGWKTLVFGALVTILGGFTAADFVPWLGEQWAGVAVAVVGVVIMAMRVVTTGPVGTSK